MDDAKIREVIAQYRQTLEETGAEPWETARDSLEHVEEEVFAHVLWMLDQMELFLEQGRREKVFRWLGFIQGALWAFSVYSIEELREHNRPE